MRFGPLQLKSSLFLSPLAGYTNLPFRLTVRALGGLDLATTDLVSARSLLENNPIALRMTATCAEDTPLAVQIFGSDPGEMRAAAQLLETRGIASIDINMGCPAPKVCGHGGGSTMMTDLPRTAALVKQVVESVKIPVTAKMRLGWDDANLTAPQLAQALEQVGVAAIFVHGRTREQGFSGRVNLAGIRAVVEAVESIPVIGNGDVTTPEAAAHMLKETGCSGVSIGRGAFYDPWIFRRTERFLATGERSPEAGFAERVEVMLGHLDRAIAFYGEEKGCKLFRKAASWYAKRFGPSSEFKRGAQTFRSRAEFHQLLASYAEWRKQFLDESGELKPQYRPPPLEASFLRDPSEAPRGDAIPVPKGPVEMW
jgi:tRNA-dihydrouridine synthase B